MNKVEIIGKIENGVIHLHPFTKNRLREDLSAFPDCEISILIKRKGKRSLPQNAYYWSVVIEEIRRRLKDLGNDFDAETVHEYLKGRFNAGKVVTAHGELLEIGQSTTKMNKEEFGEYLDKIIQWASETLDLQIPPPNTQTEIPYLIAQRDESLNSTIVKRA